MEILKLHIPIQIKFTGGIIWMLEKFFPDDTLSTKLENLRSLEKGTVGKAVAELLDKYNYRLIPQFENHDLKHVVLDYPMTMEDEICMQAYLIGNGNYTLPCLCFFLLGIFYPNTWKKLASEFNLGRKRKSIYFLTLENCMHENLTEIKKKYGRFDVI